MVLGCGTTFCPRGAHLPYPGPAGNRPHCLGLHVAVRPACLGGSCGKWLSLQPSPTYTLLLRGPCSGWPSLPLPPCSSLSAGPHTAGLAAWLPFSGESSCLGFMGWGRAGSYSLSRTSLQGQESLMCFGFDSGLGRACRLEACLRRLWLSASGRSHSGLSICQSLRAALGQQNPP